VILCGPDHGKWNFAERPGFFSRVLRVHELACMEFMSLGSAVIISFVILMGPSVSYFYRFICLL